MIRYTDEQLLAFPTVEDRLRGLLLEIIINRFDDPDPRGIPEAVFKVRKRSGLGTRQFAYAIQSQPSTICNIEAGRSRGTPPLLHKIAEYAERAQMPHAAQYLRLQAETLKFESYKKGGKRQ